MQRLKRKRDAGQTLFHTISNRMWQALDDIGFTSHCSREADRWEGQFHQLQAHREINGNVDVPSGHAALGGFVSRQKKQCKLWKDGHGGTMSAEPVRRLESLGFKWPIEHQSSKTSNANMEKEDSSMDDSSDILEVWTGEQIQEEQQKPTGMHLTQQIRRDIQLGVFKGKTLGEANEMPKCRHVSFQAFTTLLCHERKLHIKMLEKHKDHRDHIRCLRNGLKDFPDPIPPVM